MSRVYINPEAGHSQPEDEGKTRAIDLTGPTVTKRVRQFRHSEAPDPIRISPRPGGDVNQQQLPLVIPPRQSPENGARRRDRDPMPRRRGPSPKHWAWACLWLIAVACVAVAVNSDQQPMLITSPHASVPDQKKPAPVSAGLRDGAMEFTVEASQKAAPTTGMGSWVKNRQLIVVTLRIRNHSNKTVAFKDAAQILFTSKGVMYRADASLAARLASPVKQIPKSIKVGDTVRGGIVFAPPAAATPGYLQLHATAQSTGVNSKLG